MAAGGGGDALAAAMIAAATGDADEPAVIATYAWDRLMVDPQPGPRGQSSFTGVRPLGEIAIAVGPDTRPIPPSHSTLPRLAAEIEPTLALLDPSRGAAWLREQLRDLLLVTSARRVEIVDVGGDVLASGDEATLRSPLGDALVLAACVDLASPVEVLVAGPGLDGELPEEYVIERAGEITSRLTVRDLRPFIGLLGWHPSEATAIFAAAARGARGVVEMRDQGLAVNITDRSSNVYRSAHAWVIARNHLARELVETCSLEEAETIARRVCGFSEIDYERMKARRLMVDTTPEFEPLAAERLVANFERTALGRGVTFATFRRLAEAVNPAGSRDYFERLRGHLVAKHPERNAFAPLWSLRPRT